jgi:hypothetical protein
MTVPSDQPTTARVQVDDDRQVHPALGREEVGDVAYPSLVRPARSEVAVEHIGATSRGWSLSAVTTNFFFTLPRTPCSFITRAKRLPLTRTPCFFSLLWMRGRPYV